MKALLINGSPHKEGCTYTALTHVAHGLEEAGVEAEIFQLGNKAVRGCIACNACAKLGRCAFDDDVCNEIIAKLDEVQGVVIGSPVYYAHPNGAILGVMDRVFYAAGSKMRYKVGAAVSSARRAGTTATLDALYKYFGLYGMPIATSTYWPMVHGMQGAADVEQDLEGVSVMETLGTNMAWLMKCLQLGKDAGIEPHWTGKPTTNFIR